MEKEWQRTHGMHRSTPGLEWTAIEARCRVTCRLYGVDSRVHVCSWWWLGTL